MTDSEYWSEVQFLSVEIEDAISIFHTYEEMNRFAREDQAVFRALNKSPLFWNVQSFSLQTALFIILGRIFDSASQAHSIHKLLNNTVENVEFFCRSSLARRKLEHKPIAANEPWPDWLTKCLEEAWEPKHATDLKELKKALAPYAKKFDQVYRPIRHNIAHRLVTDKHTLGPLYERTNRDELGKILDFLHDLVNAIEQLYLNGIRPKLGTRSYETYNQRIRDEVRDLLGRIAASYQ